MGASSTGGRSTARPGSASRKPLTQLTSGNSRMTCRKASTMPMSSTPMISALSPGLARKAAQICRYSTITTSAHSDQEHHHPDEKDPGRRELERVEVLRHGDGISAP